MRLLLDTHIWIWSISETHNLSAKVKQEVTNPENDVWLSPISLWEALALQARGRIHLPSTSPEWLEQAASQLREATLTHEIASLAHQLAFPHRDPADRFLAATAGVLGLTLVTADQKLLGLGGIATLANR